MGVEPEQRCKLEFCVLIGCSSRMPGKLGMSWENWDRCSRGFDWRSAGWYVGPLSPLPASGYTHKVRVRSGSRFWQIMNKTVFKWSAESLRHDSFYVPHYENEANILNFCWAQRQFWIWQQHLPRLHCKRTLFAMYFSTQALILSGSAVRLTRFSRCS